MSSATKMQSPDAIAELASIWKRYEGDQDGALRAITETAAKALKTARASVWLLNEEQNELTCVDLYEAAAQKHSTGTVLRATDFPLYFKALLEEETIAADDAHTHPSTAEFSTVYLAPLGIGAMLDAPIRTGLRLVGVLCHEHIGPARAWGIGERKDAGFLASLASLTLELRSRAKREALLEATLQSTGEGILAWEGEKVLAFNQRFLDMWGLESSQMRSFSAVRNYMKGKTGLSGLIGDANEAFSEVDAESVEVIELDDGHVFERSNRPQLMGKEVVGRVWSYRDITKERKDKESLIASERKMRDLAIRDGLTGLFNRRYVLELLTDAITHAVAAGERLCIGLVDLDFFKKINDEHGHLVGDAVLRDFAKQMKDRFRASDYLGRYGGEEFLVVLRTANTEAAHRTFETFRTGFKERERGDLPNYSFSAGISELGVDGGDAMELLGRADILLYEAKRQGRDRTVSLPPALK